MAASTPNSEIKPIHKLVVVEDEKISQMFAKENLSKRGWDIVLADNGVEGLKLIREIGSTGCVVLTDLNMPEMNGLDMLNEAKGLPIEAVVLTNASDLDSVRGSFQAGAAEFAGKPVKDWDWMHKVLLDADKRLKNRKETVNYHEKLEKQADWHYWKAMYLGGGDQSEMERVLDALHVQLNQDANYPILMSSLNQVAKEDGTVTMDEAVYNMVMDALQPIARLSEGIGIAQRVLGSQPRLSNIAVSSIAQWLASIEEGVWKDLAQINSHDLQVWCDDALLTKSAYIHGDKELLSAMFTELVVNAMKYSRPGDKVSVNVQSTEPDKLNIVITNPARSTSRMHDGTIVRGIPRELTTMVFRFFIRYSIDTTNVYKENWPMGLGLPLVKEIVEQHQGQVSLKNERWHLSGGGDEPDILVTCRIEMPLHKDPLPSETTFVGRSTINIMKQLRGDVDVSVESEAGDVDGVELF